MLLTVDASSHGISFCVWKLKYDANFSLNDYIGKGCLKNSELLFSAKITADSLRSADEYTVLLENLFSINSCNKNDIEAAIVSSVAPELTSNVCGAVRSLFGIEPLLVGPGIKTGLKLRIDYSSQLGSDIAAISVAAIKLFKTPALIFDFGTATTISVINSESEFCGVVISAGLRSSGEALRKDSSQLPYVQIEAPKRIIGKNTVDSIKSGLVYGAAAQCDGLCTLISEELGLDISEFCFIATGEWVDAVAPLCKTKFNITKNLIHEGLLLIHIMNKINRKK